MDTYTITRRIGIDAGHRVMTHGSKCHHLHGHRYAAEVTCAASRGKLHGTGEQTDMVMDFSFLKDEMMRHIHDPCDHGFIASVTDLDLLRMFCPDGAMFEDWRAGIEADVARKGFCETAQTRLATKLYIIQHQPTAERLAAHWFGRLAEPVRRKSDGFAVISRLRVWETPNCYADYVNPEVAGGSGGESA